MKPKFKLTTVLMVSVALCLHACVNSKPDDKIESITLMDNLGDFHYPITTSDSLVQRYFDQGLILSFGFNHAEAARSFQQAYHFDLDCAVCYWGQALVLGPNINAPMDASAVPEAYNLVQQAIARSGSISGREQALISALSHRYQQQTVDDRTLLDESYANAMREVYQRFPNDALIAALFAESMMDVHPWDYWTKQGDAKPWTEEIVAILERALEIDVNNPLANHLYIHILEASPFVSKAIPSAERLSWLVPGSGHLVHMPAHIYIRTGHYKDAIVANKQAVKADQNYLKHQHEESLYTLAYVPHNHHFLWAAAIKTGHKNLAMKAAQDTASHVKPEMMRQPGISGTMQHFYVIPIYTHALFGDWDKILELTPPANDLLYPKAVWHYARGMAFIRKNQLAKADKELVQLDKIIADSAVSQLTIFEINKIADILQIGSYLLQSEMAAKSRLFDQAIVFAKRAVEIEDGLNYTEPKDWYLPPRQVLGAVLLEADLPQLAEQVYRHDLKKHPQNGWSLFGLAKSLEQQGHSQQASHVYNQFSDVWSDADVEITGSRN